LIVSSFGYIRCRTFFDRDVQAFLLTRIFSLTPFLVILNKGALAAPCTVRCKGVRSSMTSIAAVGHVLMAFVMHRHGRLCTLLRLYGPYLRLHLLLSLSYQLLTLSKNVKYESYSTRPKGFAGFTFLITAWIKKVTWHKALLFQMLYT